MLSFDMSQRRGGIQQLFLAILYPHKPIVSCRQYITSNIDQFNLILYVLFIYYSTCGNENKIRINSRIHVKNAVIISLYGIARRHVDHVISKMWFAVIKGRLEKETMRGNFKETLRDFKETLRAKFKETLRGDF